MKRKFVFRLACAGCLLYLLLCPDLCLARDFRTADSLFCEYSDDSRSMKELRNMLEAMLTGAQEGEMADILWRLSRVCLVEGEGETGRDIKASYYDEGITFAERAIKADPSNHNAYMWHSANAGRRCQLENLMNQASKVPVMISDFKKILDTLEVDDCSEAWQGLSEIYFHHPFKSDDSAINFARKAAMTIPSGELRLGTYLYLAQLLAARNLKTESRRSAIVKNSRKKTDGTPIERCTVLDGTLGLEYVPVWASVGLGAMSDAEEADALIKYAIKKYSAAGHRTAGDEKDYMKLLKY